jgi:hypothetical protein
MLLMHGMTVLTPVPEVQIGRIEMVRREAESPHIVRPRSVSPASLDSVLPSPHLSPRPSRQPG